ncbi:hypothetical protein BGW39_005321 [Mortierella sp. 14UC]|nr:hypothetical protein BGW39_005321 [Mortierella sp. 14UC]
MRLHILTTASALLLLTLLTSLTHGQELPPPSPVQTIIPETPCNKCRSDLIAKINPVCPEAIKLAPATPDESADPVEAFKNLPPMTGECQCVMASSGFLDPCAGPDICGPTSGLLQRNLNEIARICAILGAAEEAARRNATYTVPPNGVIPTKPTTPTKATTGLAAGGDNKSAGSRAVVAGSTLSAGLAAAVVAAITVVAL